MHNHNAGAPATGAVIVVEWTRDAFEIDRRRPPAQSRRAAVQSLHGL